MPLAAAYGGRLLRLLPPVSPGGLRGVVSLSAGRGRCLALPCTRGPLPASAGVTGIQGISRRLGAHTARRRFHGSWDDTAKKIRVTFVCRDGTRRTVEAPLGCSALEAAHHHDIELEGACEASLACSTCHVIVESQEMFEKMPPASDREDDLLDMAPGLTETSRLGCQVMLTEGINNVTLVLPKSTVNFYVDGHVPKPH